MSMKYIITDYNKVIIGSGVYHQDLASDVPGKVISAGHMRIKDGKVEVFGTSSGYMMDAKPEDAKILERHLFED